MPEAYCETLVLVVTFDDTAGHSFSVSPPREARAYDAKRERGKATRVCSGTARRLFLVPSPDCKGIYDVKLLGH